MAYGRKDELRICGSAIARHSHPNSFTKKIHLTLSRYLALLCLLLPVSTTCAQDTAAFYKRKCGACHSIGGGRLLGPDLKDVESRKDRKWFKLFLLNPKATLDQGDAYGKQILSEAHGMVMPKVSGVDEAMADALLDFIAAGGATASAGAEKPFTAADAALGEELIAGKRTLAGGGPPCIACHAFAALPGAGGGRLGPDLSSEFTRLGGRKGFTTWLSSPPTPTMQAVYSAHPLKSEEITAIAAWLKLHPAKTAPRRSLLSLSLLGSAGCLMGLLLMNAFWRKRFTSVRRPLANGKTKLEGSHS
jgi:mono/diheme cytochrome c family protein